MNITLFGKRVFADILKDLKMRSFWILWVGPKSSDKYPYRRLSEEREMEKSPCADGGRDWNFAATKAKECQESPEVGEIRKDSSLKASERVWPC